MDKKVQEIKQDGNDFHYKVKKALTDIGWTVRMSPHYNDSFSEKPREIDIIAEKAFPPVERSVYRGTVIVRLFIECKYTTEQTTFWFDERNLDKAKEVVNETRSFSEVERNYQVQTEHHYLSKSLIAKLFRTEGKNPDGDPVYKALTQCLNATIYYRHHRTDLRDRYSHQTVTELNYPIIVTNSFEKVFKKDTTTDSNLSLVAEPFQLEVDYAYTIKDKQLEEMFYIDILSIEMLKTFEEETLIKEINLAKQKMSEDKREANFQGQDLGYNPFDPYGI